MDIPIIIQARTLSTRYPRKVLQIFADDYSLLEFQLVRLKKAFPHSPVVVATTTAAADQAIEDIAVRNKVGCFRGSEHDVLERFLNCCAHFQFTGYIVRVCADNPFLQTELLSTLIREAVDDFGKIDYICFSINNIPAIRTHFGFFAEMVTVDALTRVNTIVTAPFYREHVTNFIYQQDVSDFSVRWLELNELADHLDSVRLTIDSQEDFENALFVYRHLEPPPGETDIPWRSILALVDRHPAVRASMQRQIRLYQK